MLVVIETESVPPPLGTLIVAKYQTIRKVYTVVTFKEALESYDDSFYLKGKPCWKREGKK